MVEREIQKVAAVPRTGVIETVAKVMLGIAIEKLFELDGIPIEKLFELGGIPMEKLFVLGGIWPIPGPIPPASTASGIAVEFTPRVTIPV